MIATGVAERSDPQTSAHHLLELRDIHRQFG
jgi:hypothetical protein